MTLWRISRHRDLTGGGGLRAPGRWNFAGQPIVYLSENPSTALLEVCVHTAANDVPPEFTLLRIEGPDTVPGDITIPDDWQRRLDVTRAIGTEWLKRGETVLLRVPSAITPYTFNVLFNPLHPRAQEFRTSEAIAYPFDRRIKQ